MDPRPLRSLTRIEVARLDGVGPKRVEALRSVGIDTVFDLLTHYPRRYIDRTKEARIADLQGGVVDTRVLIPVAEAAQTGAAMRLHLAGRTQRQIAAELGISLGLAHKRIAEGTNYLIVLQGIEQGIGAGP